jgi:hypothetical protein
MLPGGNGGEQARLTAHHEHKRSRWPVREIRRVAVRLAQRRVEPAHVIAWSLRRRAHQASAQRSHLKRSAVVGINLRRLR